MLQRLKRRVFRHFVFWRHVLTGAIFGGIILAVVILLLPLLRLGKETLFGPVSVFSVVFPRAAQLKSDNGRTNVLVLGIGGPEHDGPDLTDTMIVVSATASGTVSLISVPRDIYLSSLRGKVNTAYAMGREKGPDVGLVMAKAVVSQITGLPIHYAVRIDFSVFKEVIDLVDGVDIVVENSFTDDQYPIDGKENDLCGGDVEFKCRYETVEFPAGLMHMDGATALKFVRSRHALGDEGTDFARARRQQLVISALAGKLLSTRTLLNLDKDLAIYNQLRAHIDTDLDPREVVKAISLGLAFPRAKFKNVVIDLSLLENPPVDERGWILLPKAGNWDEVHDFVKRQLEQD